MLEHGDAEDRVEGGIGIGELPHVPGVEADGAIRADCLAHGPDLLGRHLALDIEVDGRNLAGAGRGDGECGVAEA